jgi:hypothetical protein
MTAGRAVATGGGGRISAVGDGSGDGDAVRIGRDGSATNGWKCEPKAAATRVPAMPAAPSRTIQDDRHGTCPSWLGRTAADSALPDGRSSN